jgi:N-acetylmuramoyl-L-alanine amidase
MAPETGHRERRNGRPVSRRRRRRRRLKPAWRMARGIASVALIFAVVWLLLPRDEPGEGREIPLPEWVEEALLPVNPYSRPGTPLEAVNGVVVHYVGNPNTTARQNNSYFRSLADTGETWASSHFLVGLEGEVLLNVPLDEVAYCSSQRNGDTISIECCHPDEEGVFTPETYASLTKLVQWLCETYDLSRDQVIRHYDVTGKECPRYYVQHPEAWETFLDGLEMAEGGA